MKRINSQSKEKTGNSKSFPPSTKQLLRFPCQTSNGFIGFIRSKIVFFPLFPFAVNHQFGSEWTHTNILVEIILGVCSSFTYSFLFKHTRCVRHELLGQMISIEPNSITCTQKKGWCNNDDDKVQGLG